MLYPIALIIHLFCATAFIGVVFFEVFILEGMRQHITENTMVEIETGLVKRARQIMPYIVGTLFLSGGYLGYTQFQGMGDLWLDSFSILLSLKIALALSVLGHFVWALTNAQNGCMNSKKFQLTHISVFTHMVFIVILAKGMFYFTW